MTKNEKKMLNEVMIALETKAFESVNEEFKGKQKNFNRGKHAGYINALDMLKDAFGKELKK